MQRRKEQKKPGVFLGTHTNHAIVS
jgi:hypothetical protein